MVVNRLQNLAEARGWWSSEQAGFRKRRSYEDQVIQPAQSISHRGSLVRVYETFIWPVMDYCGVGWQSWLAPNNIAVLTRALNKILRWITGQCRTTPVEALTLESGLPQYRTAYQTSRVDWNGASFSSLRLDRAAAVLLTVTQTPSSSKFNFDLSLPKKNFIKGRLWITNRPPLLFPRRHLHEKSAGKQAIFVLTSVNCLGYLHSPIYLIWKTVDYNELSVFLN